MFNLISVEIQLFCDGLSGLLREYWGANSIMKSEEHTRQVMDKVEKCKARLGYKKISKALNISRSNVQSITRKWSMGQLKTFQDIVVHLNLQAEQGEH